MNVAYMILGVFSYCSLTSEHEILTGIFKSNNSFDNLLPEHAGAYLMPTLKSKILECTGICLLNRLCEGVLFNSILKECKLLRCSMFGLKKIAAATTWKYFNIINECDVGWSVFKDHCYLYNETLVTWLEAKHHCESMDGYLLEIQDQEEMDWITIKLLKADVCSSKASCSTWCGGNKLMQTQFTWSHSGSGLVYTNWEPNEPNSNEQCINMRHSGQWNDGSCSKLFKFICEKPL